MAAAWTGNEQAPVEISRTEAIEKIKVETGVGDVEFVEITKGLNPGDEVFKL